MDTTTNKTTKTTNQSKANVSKAAKNDEVKNDNNSDILKKENEDLKAQMEQMKSLLKDLQSKKDIVAENTPEAESDEIVEFEEISPHKPISVVSLSDGGVSLRTSNGSSGKIFRFDKFSHKLSIIHSDLLDVLSMNRSFIEDGTVYICDKQFVKNNYLEDKYSKFLSVDKITNILNFDIEDIKEMVNNTTSTIQDTIISLLVKKINNNENVDYNKIEAIGKSCAIPCNIRDLAYKLSSTSE